MTADPNRLEAIFTAALAKTSPEERAAYLDEACGGDPKLLQRVLGLLKAHDVAGSFLQPPAAGQPLTVDQPAEPMIEGAGTRIGPYKLLQQIGEGGMGVVYMAEQEQPVRRRVALKIIKPGMDSAQVIARFEAERQALAMMDHQNIARVLDANTTESGRPYFVMELVHGVPITKFCDDSQLTPRERLELFVPVCQAIQHAHQKGIIHRDIKPSNVLVTMYDDKPVPKVIDFGVAKAIEHRLTEKTLFTQFGALVGTFEYMSPEQAEMNAFGVDTRSDIYSLGVLLYELLTGTTPLDRQRLRDAAYSELVRLIREEEPPRPSARLSSSGNLPKIAAARRTEPARLSKLVRGEIDWIVMRCLEKDRSRRYETASGLARDVERYLHDEPVEACPPSVGYRLRKFARKYRGLLATAAAFGALLLVATAVSLWLALKATWAETRADQRREEAVTAEQKAVEEGKRANQAEEETKVNAAETRRALNRMTVAKGIQLAEEGNPFMALSWLVKPLERGGLTPEEERIHRIRIACYLRYTPGMPRLRHIFTRDASKDQFLRGGDFAAFSPNGKRVLMRAGNEIHVWDLQGGKQLAPLQHSEKVQIAQFGLDCKRVLAVAAGAVWTWDAGNGQLLSPPFLDWEGLLQQPLAVLALSSRQCLGAICAQTWTNAPLGFQEISRDGSRAVSVFPGAIRLLDLQTRKPIGQWLADERLKSLDLSPNGQFLALNRDGQINVHDTVAGKTTTRWINHGSPVTSFTFSPDGTRALTIGDDGFAQVWDARTWHPLARFRLTKGNGFGSFSPDNRLVASWDADSDSQDLGCWDVESGRLIRNNLDTNSGLNFSFSGFNWRPDGQQLLRFSVGGEVTLWNAFSEWSMGMLLPHNREMIDAVYAPDGRTLLTATASEVQIWDLSGRREGSSWHVPEKDDLTTELQLRQQLSWKSWSIGIAPITIKAKTVTGAEEYSWPNRSLLMPIQSDRNDICFEVKSPDQSRAVTILETSLQSLQLWDARSRQQVGKPLETTRPFTHVGFSPNSRWVVAASEDKTARLVNAQTGDPVGLPMKHDGQVTYAAFSSDSELVVTCSEDSTARLWRAKTGEPVGEKLYHGAPVTRAAFFPSGEIVATASVDSTVRLWEVSRGTPLGVLEQKKSFCDDLALDPKGSLLLVSSRINPRLNFRDRSIRGRLDPHIRIWDVASLQEVTPLVEGSRSFLEPLRIRFQEDGRVGFGLFKRRILDLTPDLRPVGDLVKLAQLYSGRCLDAQGGTVPLSQKERQALWRELRAKYPEEFAVSSEAALAWRIDQLQATTRDQPTARALHRRWLGAELAEAGWQPGERGNENMELDNYLLRLLALAQHGRHTEAVAAAEVLANRWSKDGGTLYDCACVHALAAGAVRGDAALADPYAGRAVALLRQAVGAGFEDDDKLLKDPDLDALRRRDDFVQLLWELAAGR